MMVRSMIFAMLLVAISAVTADKRIRPSSFQRQTSASSEKPESGPYPPSGWKPEKPQSSTEPAPYPPSGWKPDGPQLEAGPPPKQPETVTSVPDRGDSKLDSSTASAPAKFVSFVAPENIVYYVLPDGKVQELVITPRSTALLARTSYRQVGVSRPLQLQVVDSHIVEVDSAQIPAFYSSFDSPSLLRVARKT